MTLRKKIIAFIEAYCKILEGIQLVQPMKLMKFQRQVIFWRSMTTCMESAMLVSALLKNDQVVSLPVKDCATCTKSENTDWFGLQCRVKAITAESEAAHGPSP